MGTVGILNVGAGDTKLTFDRSNPAECVRAARIVTDMLRRGYALLVDIGGGKMQRVHEFDEKTCEYIIADFDPAAAVPRDSWPDFPPREVGPKGAHYETPPPPQGKESPPPEAKKATRGRKTTKKRIGADSTNAVAVARTAGG